MYRLLVGIAHSVTFFAFGSVALAGVGSSGGANVVYCKSETSTGRAYLLDTYEGKQRGLSFLPRKISITAEYRQMLVQLRKQLNDNRSPTIEDEIAFERWIENMNLQNSDLPIKTILARRSASARTVL